MGKLCVPDNNTDFHPGMARHRCVVRRLPCDQASQPQKSNVLKVCTGIIFKRKKKKKKHGDALVPMLLHDFSVKKIATKSYSIQRDAYEHAPSQDKCECCFKWLRKEDNAVNLVGSGRCDVS
ncbi:hypothetical protein AVEN_226833-1 [Araneus ventricosus]|uniref:Uncharacterized protein n=1 Tax=Araneus ventricosus TaxID=182803 RepID=A0A4Y2JM49_ARAVE|nr:hypothetical protein AVEN_226833-1 [Araneus ventricosus]